MCPSTFVQEKNEIFEKFRGEWEEVIEKKLKNDREDVTIPKPISAGQEEWLSERIKRCKVVYDFKKDPAGVLDEKGELLEDLLEFFSGDPGPVSRQAYRGLFEMFSANLFRSIPQSKKRNYDPKEDGHAVEAAWPHVKAVYDLFATFIGTSHLRVDYSKIYLNDRYVHELVQLLDSDDSRERDAAVYLLHRIYARFLTLRRFIRRELRNVILDFVYGQELFGGIGEILLVYSCIVDGLSLPMSGEYVILLEKVLLPMHKVKSLSDFHENLTTCLIKFLMKDPKVFKPVIDGLIKYWPKTDSLKEVLFLEEIERLLEVVSPEGFMAAQAPLFTQIGKCVLSLNFQVAEKALNLLGKEAAWELIRRNYHAVLPLVLPPLLKARKGHWNQTVAVLVNDALKRFKSVDATFFDEAVVEASKLPEHMEKITKKSRKEKISGSSDKGTGAVVDIKSASDEWYDANEGDITEKFG